MFPEHRWTEFGNKISHEAEQAQKAIAPEQRDSAANAAVMNAELAVISGVAFLLEQQIASLEEVARQGELPSTQQLSYFEKQYETCYQNTLESLQESFPDKATTLEATFRPHQITLKQLDDVAGLLRNKKKAFKEYVARETLYANEAAKYVMKSRMLEEPIQKQIKKSRKQYREPLIHACSQHNFAEVKRIAETEAKKSVPAKKGLISRVFKKNAGIEVREYLNCAEERGFHALHVLFVDYMRDEYYNNLKRDDRKNGTQHHQAAVKKLLHDVHEIAEYLLSHGIDASIKTGDGYTPLHLAAMHGYAVTAQLLIKYDADVTATIPGDGHKRTPLHNAAFRGNDAIVKMLIRAGAKINALTDDDDGNKTALHDAARRGQAEIVRFLIDKGADVQAKDRWGISALSYAVSSGEVNAVNYLLMAGAQVPPKGKQCYEALLKMVKRQKNHAMVMLLHSYYVQIHLTINETHPQYEKHRQRYEDAQLELKNRYEQVLMQEKICATKNSRKQPEMNTEPSFTETRCRF